MRCFDFARRILFLTLLATILCSAAYSSTVNFVQSAQLTGSSGAVQNVELNLTKKACTGDICTSPPESNHYQTQAVNKPLLAANSTIGYQKNHNLFSVESQVLYTTMGFWVVGLLLAFTPCVLPLIILIASFIGSNNEISYVRSILLSLTYVFALACTLSLMGVLAAGSGIYLQLYFQNKWVIGGFSFILAFFALSLMGFYRIHLPIRLQHTIAYYNKLKPNYRFIEVALMGVVATLITSPCIAAPLLGAFSYIASSQDIFYGASALFFFGLGMGTPLIAAVSINKKLLPQSGLWQLHLKFIFGLSLFGVAIYISTRLMPDSSMLIWSFYIIFIAVYLNQHVTPYVRGSYLILINSLNILILAYGLSVFVGCMVGNRNLLDPLYFVQTIKKSSIAFQTISSKVMLTEAIDNAVLNKKPTLLYFFTTYCVACDKLDNDIFSNESIKLRLNNFVLLKVDLSNNFPYEREIASQYNVVGTPEIIFFNSSGGLINARIVGAGINAKQFEIILDKIKDQEL